MDESDAIEAINEMIERLMLWDEVAVSAEDREAYSNMIADLKLIREYLRKSRGE